jgi:putative ABC transport system substrate-binding protein
MPDQFTTTNGDLIIALAARYGVPAIYNDRIFSQSGGLIAYGTDFGELFRQAAGYIDRILKGAKPGELPIQMPTKYELVINRSGPSEIITVAQWVGSEMGIA